MYTLPVLVGMENARLFLATVIFLCYFISAYVINEKGAILPALFFGSVSYFFVSNQKSDPRHLVWYVLGLVFFYGLVLTRFVFK